MIHKYNRMKGVPREHKVLMKVVCFGEMGGPFYSDKIIIHADTEEEIKDYCKKEKILLNDPNGWNEYFITTAHKLLSD